MERDTPFETPWASNQLPNPRICPPWWLGRHTTKSPRHSARYSPDARYGEKRGPRIDRHPMGLCRCFCLRSSAVTRTMISDTAVARSARNCAKKGDRKSFHGFWPFLGEKGFVCCRVFGIASPGCPRPRRRLSVLHEDARALTYTRITSCSSSADYL